AEGIAGTTFTVTATGIPTPALSTGSTLPTGVTFTDNGNGTGTLAGTPAANTHGTYSITFSATSAVGTASQSFTLIIELPPTAPSTPALTCPDPDGIITSACGSPPTFTGTAQAGTTVKIYDGATLISSGTDTAAAYASPGITTSNLTTPGTHSITATATDAAGFTSSPSGALVLAVPGAVSAATIGTVNSDSSPYPFTQAATIPVGDTIFVAIAMDPSTSNVTVTDNATGGSNTYTKDADVPNGSGTTGVRTLLFSAPVSHALDGTALHGTITVNFPSFSNKAAATFFSANGLVSPLPVDKSHTATGNGTGADSGPTATTSQPDELLIGALGWEDKQAGINPGAGFTALSFGSTNSGSNDSNVTMLPEYRVVT